MTTAATTSGATAAPRSLCLRAMNIRAMNTDVVLRLVGPGGRGEAALAAARQVFVDVEAACTRFDPTSPLMRANAAGTEWLTVPAVCFHAVTEAAAAHRDTGGLFDPRVLESLVAMGYDRTLPFQDGPVHLRSTRSPAEVPAVICAGRDRSAGSPVASAPAGPQAQVVPPTPWAPGLDPLRHAVRIGPAPIDLGGIGKGLAVGWAAQLLGGVGEAFLVEAGGDCALGGAGPDGDGWKVGVEDPSADGQRQDDEQPIAVLSLTDTGCATSSLRRRTWRAGGEQVHHVVDPRTGRSAAGGLRSVTVVLPDPARAEVWSKTLLVAGVGAIASLAAEQRLAALWVDDEGHLGLSEAMRPWVIWRSSDGV